MAKNKTTPDTNPIPEATNPIADPNAVIAQAIASAKQAIAPEPDLNAAPKAEPKASTQAKPKIALTLSAGKRSVDGDAVPVRLVTKNAPGPHGITITERVRA